MQGGQTATEEQTATVSPDLKEAINAVLIPKLEQNHNFFSEKGSWTRNVE